ncbi:hypothetical protein FJ444_20210 [Aestuariibacter sp. GS-14]|uniref:VanZ family protein n=1 Tax=Aestuariibacter sp. GS-14 TaxID=2590670 RepID=UPI00112B90BB|nr:VanZ family protein [Aestuariibacter sp. GS-14]TPV53856.1 hypothetical protein FJ444_20210 [Aestuariibacter sp. GS-14]
MSVQEELITKPPKSRPLIPFPVILVVVFSILSALFFVPVPKWMSGPLGAAILNTGHIIFFSVFAMAFYRFTKGKNRTRIPRFLLMVFLLSLLIELLQSSVGRSFQWSDILRNILGTLLGISILLHFQRPHKPHWALRISLFIAISVAVVIERIPLIEKLASL